MAYLDLAASDALVGIYPPAPASVERPRLNSAERAAVMLARSDRASSLVGTTYLHKAVEVVFGLHRPNRLADIRLETLRRFAIAVAHNRPRLAEWEAHELRLFRYSEQEIGEALDLAAQFHRPRSTGGWVYAVLALLLVASFLWVRTAIGDDQIALITVAVFAIPLWAAIAPRRVARSRR